MVNHEYLVGFEQLARVGHGFLRVEAVVQRGVADLPAVHSPLGVDGLEQQPGTLGVLHRLRPQRP